MAVGTWRVPAARADPDGAMHSVDHGRVQGAGCPAHPLHTVCDTLQLSGNNLEGLIPVLLGRRAAAERTLSVFREPIPWILASTETLRRSPAAWFKTSFGELLTDLPALRVALRRIIYIEKAEAVMYTCGQCVANEKKDAEA